MLKLADIFIFNFNTYCFDIPVQRIPKETHIEVWWRQRIEVSWRTTAVMQVVGGGGFGEVFSQKR